MAYQVRSFYQTFNVATIYHALKKAEEDQYVWKISFQDPYTSLRYRLIRDDENTNIWYQQPVPFADDYAPPSIFTNDDLRLAFFIPLSSA